MLTDKEYATESVVQVGFSDTVDAIWRALELRVFSRGRRRCDSLNEFASCHVVC